MRRRKGIRGKVAGPTRVGGDIRVGICIGRGDEAGADFLLAEVFLAHALFVARNGRAVAGVTDPNVQVGHSG